MLPSLFGAEPQPSSTAFRVRCRGHLAERVSHGGCDDQTTPYPYTRPQMYRARSPTASSPAGSVRASTPGAVAEHDQPAPGEIRRRRAATARADAAGLAPTGNYRFLSMRCCTNPRNAAPCARMQSGESYEYRSSSTNPPKGIAGHASGDISRTDEPHSRRSRHASLATTIPSRAR